MDVWSKPIACWSNDCCLGVGSFAVLFVGIGVGVGVAGTDVGAGTEEVGAGV